jgi:dihydroorotate dehydrogenase
MSLYRRLLRPPLFRLPAERAHHLALAALRMPLPWGLIGGALRDPRLEVELAGLRLRNPVGLAAGFDKDCRVLRALDRLGFGYLVGGTVTAAPRPGNPRPRVSRYPDRKSAVNAMGFPNRGAAAAARRLASTRTLAPVVVSVSGSAAADVLAAFELVEPQAAGIEFNVSCPNVRWGRDHDTEEMLKAALPRMRELTRKPLFVKVPPYREEKGRQAVLTMALIAQEAGVDAITATNTLPIDAPEMAIGTGGLSGRALFPGTVRIVRDLYTATGGRLAINACGGVFSAGDALACIEAGARTVQVYTGLIYRGPGLVGEITRGLVAHLRLRSTELGSLVGTGA